MADSPTVALLGGGMLGQALLEGALASGEWPAGAFRVTTGREESARRVRERFGVACGTGDANAVEGAGLVLLCVKPRTLPSVCRAIAPALAAGVPVVSCAAGVPLADLRSWLPESAAVIRAMPNLPCRVRSGMTVLCPAEGVPEEATARAETFFQSLGRVRRLGEEHLDTVTGLSASGPAFLYLVLESLTDGGVMAGLPRGAAMELAAQTTLGAARMVLETGEHPAALKDAVTTPAGCTISALLKLEDGRLRSVLARAVEEAARAAAGLRPQTRSGGPPTPAPPPEEAP